MTVDDLQSEPTGCESTLSAEDVRRVREHPQQRDVDVFAALANDTRYEILRLIMSADGSVCGCELEPHLDVAQSSVSQSLSRLRKAGLLSRTKQGRWRYYDTTPLAEALLETVDTSEQDSKVSA